MAKVYDSIIVGGGFFGLNIALYLRSQLHQKKVLVIEKEADFMQRASYNNQARVHGGYHYPRSLLTGLRSQANFSRFVEEYHPAIVSDFDKYYAIARQFSKVSARQFKLFCDRINAHLTEAPESVKELFNRRMVEDVFVAKEYAFNAQLLKDDLIRRLTEADVSLRTGTAVERIAGHGPGLILQTDSGEELHAGQVFNCAYSMINNLNVRSGLPLLPLKHELTEMCLITLPKELEHISVTMMCGPFFSFMPFPARGLTTLSHVRYTPHSEWHDTDANSYRDSHQYLADIDRVSHFPQMVADAKRYIPALGNATYKDSLWEVKTVLPQSEQDDSRPILFRKDHGLKGYHCVMGGKMDNVYDVFYELEKMYA